MESINKILQNKKILILNKENKKNKTDFGYVHIFDEEKDAVDKAEKFYKEEVYQGAIGNPLKCILINENECEINLYNVWQFDESYIFLSKEKYCECFEEFIRFQVLHNDYNLVPEYLINYAIKLEKQHIKLGKIEKEGKNKGKKIEDIFKSEEYKNLEEEIQKTLDNALKRANKKCYLGEMIVLEI